MIPERLEKVNAWLDTNRKDAFTAAFIFLVGLGSFGLGRLSVLWPEKEPITITGAEVDGSATEVANDSTAWNTGAGSALPSTRNIGNGTATSAPGKYVASKSGSYYHFPWCAGALRIKDTNKIWFATKQEAENRGLKPASNCPGL